MPTKLAMSLTLPALLLATLCSPAAEADRTERLRSLADEVSAAERAFARTMAERDLQAFAGFVAGDAVFRSGRDLLVGRDAVVEGWRSEFKPGPAPFSWEPDRVTVAESGGTAISSGPVRDPDGRIIGRFTTIWRKESELDGSARWRVIVDQGVPLLECAAPGH
jgi:ketosteroid isomerase-like protein